MKNISSALFKGFTDEEYDELFACGGLREESYKKEDYIYMQGYKATDIGMIIEGSVNIQSTNYWGDTILLSQKKKGQIFAEAYALSGEDLLVDVVATEKTSVLFIKASCIFNCYKRARSWHEKIINNLLLISSKNNLALSERIFQTSYKKIRPKVSAYLSALAIKNKSNEFYIPFDRNELSDYLNVDRSALSRELMNMKKEGLIEYKKNHFILYRNLEN
ncbi:MAG: Crp/Fnr family transcriptional regulator [Tissierellia bacterium]|nr:Crp/Fnr family transcriptional regulator [Tissierellia bacterium]